MTSLAKSIVRIGLLAFLALPLSMLPHTQLSRSDALNTASLITVVDNLHRQNFLTESTYQKVRRLIELGGIQGRSHLLRCVIEDSFRRWSESSEISALSESSVCGSENTTRLLVISGEMPFAELQKSL
ncbi:MAG: hypothetical protein HC840_01545 [Leptolyngbyaceae cyanobacterium RM2_2_4]|nr:hypothetical protein [Leptolyngbyaceae cyanobacterium SM1_4_3]NJO48374.1 hypothetical protein [Leptolyngbyaceae cyanobacterium RM2_2_4]